MPFRPAVFLDRDGTLNQECGYIADLKDLKLISGAAVAVRKLNQAGIAAVLVTNQSGAARGYYSEDHIRNLNAKLELLLKESGAVLDCMYYCPHLPEAPVKQYESRCNCRKPATGLVERALTEIPDLDRSRLYVVGDKATDIELATNLNAKGILVTTGYGQDVLEKRSQLTVVADAVCKDVLEAVDWILNDLSMND